MVRAALITAGGTGIRMGADIPKQYLDLMGIPILAGSIAAFNNHPMIDIIVLTVPFGHEEFCRSGIVDRFSFDKVKSIVPGGPTRQASVYNGLKQVAETDLVAIHDGVRPLISAKIISETILSAETVGAAAACVRVSDTVKRKQGGYLTTVDREHLWLAHTPQAFLTSLIIKAHQRALDDDYQGTDDCSLVERMGFPIEIVEDSPHNIKITTPNDLDLAAFYLESKKIEGFPFL